MFRLLAADCYALSAPAAMELLDHGDRPMAASGIEPPLPPATSSTGAWRPRFQSLAPGGVLFAGPQLARQRREQFGTIRFDDARRLGRCLGLAEIQLLDSPRALFDLVGGNQDLADVFVGLAKMVLQLQHALAQAAEVVAEMHDLGADLVGGVAHPRVLQD